MRIIALAFLLLLFINENSLAKSPSPITVPLIKLQYPEYPSTVHSVYVQLLGLGTRRVNIPLLFDTGAVGVTVECAATLGGSLCSSDGILIDHALQLDGLTVSTRRIIVHYGAYDDYGNLAYAQVTIGDSRYPVSTNGPMPIMIRYKRVHRASGNIVAGPIWPRGVFGVSPVNIQADGALPSPMERIDMPDGLDRGFYLTPFGEDWPICTDEPDRCSSVKALHIGIDDVVRHDFEIIPLQFSGVTAFSPFVDTCLKWMEHQSCRPTLYDTGNSAIEISGPPRGSLTSEMAVTVVGSNPTPWNFVTVYPSEVGFAPHKDINVIGIRYFETNSLLFDLDARLIGFRIGR